MKIIILSLLFILSLTFNLNANEVACKKFDITCKTKKYINDTKEFQKDKWDEINIKKSKTKK
jgi:hypothetical protein